MKNLRVSVDESGKSILLFVVGAFVALVIGLFFFNFTNTGLGVSEMVVNALSGDPAVPEINEVVMPPNASITANTQAGTITIRSGKGLKRYYTWDGATRSVVMEPRRERWLGSFGIYYPGPGSHWLPVNGINRGVVEEGQQNFDTLEDAEDWLSKSCQHCVYNDSGLVVNFLKVPGRKQINVDVWQIHIGGQVPSQYPESTFRDRFTTDSDQQATEFEARYQRSYYTDGTKPVKLKGSDNSAIVTSW